MKRDQGTPAPDPEGTPLAKPAPGRPTDQHSGEGSASALASLRKMEDDRAPSARPDASEMQESQEPPEDPAS